MMAARSPLGKTAYHLFVFRSTRRVFGARSRTVDKEDQSATTPKVYTHCAYKKWILCLSNCTDEYRSKSTIKRSKKEKQNYTASHRTVLRSYRDLNLFFFVLFRRFVVCTGRFEYLFRHRSRAMNDADWQSDTKHYDVEFTLNFSFISINLQFLCIYSRTKILRDSDTRCVDDTTLTVTLHVAFPLPSAFLAPYAQRPLPHSRHSSHYTPTRLTGLNTRKPLGRRTLCVTRVTSRLTYFYAKYYSHTHAHIHTAMCLYNMQIERWSLRIIYAGGGLFHSTHLHTTQQDPPPPHSSITPNRVGRAPTFFTRLFLFTTNLIKR